MRWHGIAWSVGVAAILTAPVAAQESDETAELRQQIEALQEQLDAMESTGRVNRRVTQIGGSSVTVREPEQVTRIYDLSDLFALAPPYEAHVASDLGGEHRPLFQRTPSLSGGGGFGGSGLGGGGFGGGGGGLFRVQDQPDRVESPGGETLHQAGMETNTARSSMDDLIQTITNTISPADWVDGGGNYTINALGPALVASCDRETHEQISGLLDAFRQRWRSLRTVSIRAWWLWLDDREFASLVGDDAAAGDGQPFGVVPGDRFVEWMKGLAEIGDGHRAGYRSAITCYNGQTVFTLSGGQSMAVTGLAPVSFSGSGGVAYEPTTSIVQEGAALQVTPIATRTGKYVVLDVHSRVTQVQGSERPPVADAVVASQLSRSPAHQVAEALDGRQVIAHQLSTTLRMPVDEYMLVGGMTFDSVPQAGEQSLYLFIKASVQELLDDTPPTEVEPVGGSDAAEIAPQE